MSGKIMWRAALAAAALLTFTAWTDGVSAKSKSKTTGQRLSVAAIAPAPESAPRFFTINQILRARYGTVKEAPIRLASIDAAAVLRGTMSDLSGSPAAASDEPFGLTTFRAPEGLLWVKWRAIERTLEREADVITACRNEPENCSSPAARAFIALVDDARSHSGRARIEVVNRTINASVRYLSDYAQHGVPDLWSAPLATLKSGYGDCEDYAIAKFFALRDAGVPAENLRLVLVRDRAVRQDHAVLAVRHADKWLILDNRHTRVEDAQDIGSFTPLFAINDRGVQLFARPYMASKARADDASTVATADHSAADASWAASDEAGPSSSNAAQFLL